MLLFLRLLSQAVRHQVRGLRAGHPPHPGGAARAVARLPPALLRVRGVRADAQHWRRVLPDGGRKAGLQAGLRSG